MRACARTLRVCVLARVLACVRVCACVPVCGEVRCRCVAASHDVTVCREDLHVKYQLPAVKLVRRMRFFLWTAVQDQVEVAEAAAVYSGSLG